MAYHCICSIHELLTDYVTVTYQVWTNGKHQWHTLQQGVYCRDDCTQITLLHFSTPRDLTDEIL